ncbi:glycoside hydrolase family protein [Caulobacter sp. S45]|uniref:glycoside hydrolase family protein n=1 Tax=Caulobacter sp. S45 TaxID=1641861 RepID=UPI0015766E5F|nr:glycoside hydrolase family protein [Caulobacter sp. S45]
MTTPKLRDDLIADEGLREHAYADAGGVWTIGVGHTGPEVRRGLVWSRETCLQALEHDIARAEQGLDAHLSWWRGMSPERQDVLANMAFNLGVEGLLAFRHTLEAVQAADYDLAARRMLASEPWRSQVGARAMRLAAQMRTGVRSHGGEP